MHKPTLAFDEGLSGAIIQLLKELICNASIMFSSSGNSSRLSLMLVVSLLYILCYTHQCCSRTATREAQTAPLPISRNAYHIMAHRKAGGQQGRTAYLVLQGSVPSRTSQFKHIVQLIARTRLGTRWAKYPFRLGMLIVE